MSNFNDLDVMKRAWTFFRQERRWYTPAVVAAVSGLSRLIMTRLNRLEIDGIERLHGLMQRSGRGLLTFSNHVSLFDDPWIPSCFVVPPYDQMRWVAADARNFFDKDWKALILSAGKTVPVVRGLGLDQPGFHFLSRRLREGDWVHLFPEGGRTRDATARLKPPFKPGIGKLIDDAEPWVLPFFHRGMEAILPVGAHLPRTGQTVHVHFGEPTLLDRDRITAITGDAPDERERLKRLTRWSQSELEAMEAQHRSDGPHPG